MPRVSSTVDQARTLLERRPRAQRRAQTGGVRPRGPRPQSPSRSGKARQRATATRRRRGSTRADQAVRIIKQNPGITVSELGRKMKLNHPNYLYRVLPDLQKEGRIKRKGQGYHPGG